MVRVQVGFVHGLISFLQASALLLLGGKSEQTMLAKP